MEQSSIKISVVTPSLNQGRYIEETILSVLEQRYENFEHIILDGGSTDQTIEILRKYPHLCWVSEPDEGQTPAINKGFRMSTGQVFAYLNADDLYRPGAFRAVAEVFHGDPTTAIVIGDCDVIDGESKLTGEHRGRLERYEDLLRYWEWGNRFCVPQPATFLHRQVLEDVGLFDEGYDLAMDYEMWLRAGARYPFTILHRTVAAFRVTDQTKTNRYRRQMDLEQFRAARKHCRLARWPERWIISCGAVWQRLWVPAPSGTPVP